MFRCLLTKRLLKPFEVVVNSHRISEEAISSSSQSTRNSVVDLTGKLYKNASKLPLKAESDLRESEGTVARDEPPFPLEFFNQCVANFKDAPLESLSGLLDYVSKHK